MLIAFFSQQFGFINWRDLENRSLRDLVQRAINALQNIITLSEQNANVKLSKSDIDGQCKTLCVKSESQEAAHHKLEFLSINCPKVKIEDILESDNKSSDELEHHLDRDTFCKLGHLHLVLEEYNEGKYNKFCANVKIIKPF